MIQKVEMYRAVCDRCKKKGWAFSTPALAVQHAKSRLQWQEINGKLYCPDCVENKTDNVTISARGSELFTIIAKGKLLEEIKEEISEE